MSATKLTRREAQILTNDIREGLLNADKALRSFIAGNGWVAMGFTSFKIWWDANLSDVTLAAELRAHVVYQMLAENESVDDIADAVKHVGPESVRDIKRQQDNGVPADSISVRPHNRSKPSEPSVLRIDVGTARLREYRKIAHDYGMPVEEIAAQAISDRFDILLAVETQRSV